MDNNSENYDENTNNINNKIENFANNTKILIATPINLDESTNKEYFNPGQDDNVICSPASVTPTTTVLETLKHNKKLSGVKIAYFKECYFKLCKYLSR